MILRQGDLNLRQQLKVLRQWVVIVVGRNIQDLDSQEDLFKRMGGGDVLRTQSRTQ